MVKFAPVRLASVNPDLVSALADAVVFGPEILFDRSVAVDARARFNQRLIGHGLCLLSAIFASPPAIHACTLCRFCDN
jgi:hypothetical protein